LTIEFFRLNLQAKKYGKSSSEMPGINMEEK